MFVGIWTWTACKNRYSRRRGSKMTELSFTCGCSQAKANSSSVVRVKWQPVHCIKVGVKFVGVVFYLIKICMYWLSQESIGFVLNDSTKQWISPYCTDLGIFLGNEWLCSMEWVSWNSLSPSVCQCHTLLSFKSQPKTHRFSKRQAWFWNGRTNKQN